MQRQLEHLARNNLSGFSAQGRFRRIRPHSPLIQKNGKQVFLILFLLVFGVSACTAPAPTSTPTEQPTNPPPPTSTLAAQPTQSPEAPTEEPIYLAIIWHQHQPVYYKDPLTGIYAKPWVRVHATKDYVDMAAILEQYPEIQVTFNLTPSLIRQLDDLENGAKDLYWVTAEIPATDLNDEQKQFLLDRFFDTNRKIIARFPRYQELLDQRDAGEAFSTQDFLDLQILFNLAWTDPDWLAQAPLADLVSRGEGFSESDKAILFAEQQRLIAEVIPEHRKLQDAGQIEVTMTPFAHPILPLLISTDLAKVALPDIELPSKKFQYGEDAVSQIQLGVQLYQDHFGMSPRGMWPAEGSVAQEIVTMVSKAGIQWMASDEGVLANSLGFTDFTRDSNEVVNQADQLYRPYYVQGSQSDPVGMVFRDVVLSDKVGFTYSGMGGQQAADDFLNRVHAIREKLIEDGSTGPHLVSVILDGENAWEYYDNDGKEFLHSLYAGLSDDPLIKTVTPSEFLSLAPDQPKIENLWAGSWIKHDFSTWIGETEENQAWDLLADTRAFLKKYENGIRTPSTPEALKAAQTLMYIAEGSDWFWWYGADQDSGDDAAFDRQYRDTLKQVYSTLGEAPPVQLDVPIIPLQPVSADQASSGLITPIIDGTPAEGEWSAGGEYQASGGVMAAAQPYFASLGYGFDASNLYFKIEQDSGFNLPPGESQVELYLALPGSGAVNSFSRGGTLLGFGANRLVDLSFQGDRLAQADIYAAQDGDSWQLTQEAIASVAAGDHLIELGLPYEVLGRLDTGDRISLRAIYTQAQDRNGITVLLDQDRLPLDGPALIAVPDLGTSTVVLDVDDPENDDYGPGTYTYPTDSVFAAGNFDLLHFQVGYDDRNIIFKINLRGPVDNPWGSPNGLSVQTIDIYLDQDGDQNGGEAMLPGRNLALADGYRWDYAITAEGWEPAIFKPGADGPEKVATGSQFSILTDPGQRKVTILVPKDLLGDNPTDWKYAVIIMGQEGYPSSGVMRVRDVSTTAEQWRFGGAPSGATNHTRVIDLVWPAEGEQEAWLSDFPISSSTQADLTAADFASVPMLPVEQ